MPGLSTYHISNRTASAQVGYAIMQALKQGYLTNTNVTSATGVDDLIANVEAAVVSAGAASPSQRQSIIAALREGKRLGDLSDARVAAATSATDLAEKTWVTDDPAYLTHLATNLVP